MSDDSKKTVNPLWGGRFAAGPSAVMARINPSIGFDRRLWAEDIEGSKAHCAMLVAQGIIPAADGRAILEGLDRVAAEIAAGTFTFRDDLEDIHMNVEARLAELIGAAAGRLHTARSRNDQVATDLRLWTRVACDRIDAELAGLQAALIDQAERHAGTVMPGFTHLQPAQPVTFGHHLLAYVEMVGRDRGRVADARRRLDECPLGAAALAGTSFPIDRDATARTLGFARPCANSMDAVADRDFVVEVLAMAALAATHLSRLAEELVLWASPAYGFVTLPEALTSGSSIMPQKRNPDAAELVRAKVGRVLGAFNAIVVVLKGLPLTYQKDMQEDKEPTMDALASLSLAIAATAGMVRDMKANAAVMKKAAGQGYSTATDLADWCVRSLGIPFRESHHIAAKAVGVASAKGLPLHKLTLADMQGVDKRITADVFSVLSVSKSVASRTSYGGTAPKNVRAQAKRWLKKLG